MSARAKNVRRSVEESISLGRCMRTILLANTSRAVASVCRAKEYKRVSPCWKCCRTASLVAGVNGRAAVVNVETISFMFVVGVVGRAQVREGETCLAWLHMTVLVAMNMLFVDDQL